MFEKLLKNIASALFKKDIPYMIIGGQAVLLYGEPRLTRDIDVTLGVGVEKLPLVLDAVKVLNLKVLPSDPQDFVKRSWVLPVMDGKTKIRIDFIFSYTFYEQQAIKRGKDVRIDRRKVRFASVEDVIIHKIFAGRPRDIDDVKSIIIKNRDINKKYIRSWLKEFESASSEEGANLLKLFNECLKDFA